MPAPTRENAEDCSNTLTEKSGALQKPGQPSIPPQASADDSDTCPIDAFYGSARFTRDPMAAFAGLCSARLTLSERIRPRVSGASPVSASMRDVARGSSISNG